MLEDISALENCTVSSVPDGYDAFLLAQLWEKSDRDILYIVSDGVALENTAHILSVIRPEAEVLKFPVASRYYGQALFSHNHFFFHLLGQQHFTQGNTVGIN